MVSAAEKYASEIEIFTLGRGFRTQISRSSVQKRRFNQSMTRLFGRTDFFNRIGRMQPFGPNGSEPYIGIRTPSAWLADRYKPVNYRLTYALLDYDGLTRPLICPKYALTWWSPFLTTKTQKNVATHRRHRRPFLKRPLDGILPLPQSPSESMPIGLRTNGQYPSPQAKQMSY